MLLPDPTYPPAAPGAPLDLDELVMGVDAAAEADPPLFAGGVLLKVTDDPPEVSALPFEGDHPLDMLMGFTAPVQWRAIGLRSRARAYDLGSPNEPGGPPGATGTGGQPEPAIVTVLVDRTGAGSGLLRRGALTTRLPGMPEGVVGDACRRALGLPTPPPPASTVELWLRVWLDRVVEAAAFTDDPDRLASWPAVAALHPAAPARRPSAPLSAAPPDGAGFGDPEAVAETTHVLSSAWPWSRLRHDPDVVDTARPPLPRAAARWMDDGMFARWVLADFADLGMLVRSVRALLGDPVADEVDETVRCCGLGTRLAHSSAAT
jgi:hypothetical protein